jgi:hypothetical protein
LYTLYLKQRRPQLKKNGEKIINQLSFEEKLLKAGWNDQEPTGDPPIFQWTKDKLHVAISVGLPDENNNYTNLCIYIYHEDDPLSVAADYETALEQIIDLDRGGKNVPVKSMGRKT